MKLTLKGYKEITLV